jgi:hypothetical protein
MLKLTTLTALCIGFFAGFFCMSLVGGTVRLLYAMLGKGTGAGQPFPPKRTLWALPLLLLRPGVWILLAIPYLFYLIYSGRVSRTWAWSFVGFFFSIVYVSTLAFLVMRKAKRKRARAVGA